MSDPITTAQRTRVLGEVADTVEQCPTSRVLVGVDGRPGSGKSTFADELAQRLRERGRAVVRSTTDSFHLPRNERGRLGPTSAEGYLHESHQLDVVVSELLEPFRQGRPRVRVAAFDEPTDQPLEVMADVADEAVLVFDGLFVHRHEFAPFWDVTVLLEANRRCDSAWLAYLESDLPIEPSARAAELDRRLERARWPRYRHGWRLYLDAVDPARTATVLVDNNDLASPTITRTVRHSWTGGS